MLARTHAAFGLLVAIISYKIIGEGNPFFFFSLVVFGSLLPDLDHPNSKLSQKIPIIPRLISMVSKHRGISHSIFAAVIVSGLLYYFTSPIYGVALFLGYLSHLFMDGLTPRGINFLQPFGRLHLAGFVPTGSYAELVVFLVILSGIVVEII